MDNKSISHTRWKCQYHIVFIPKYWKKVLYGKLRDDVREIISTLCQYKNVEIVAGAVCIDHVRLSVAIPPKMSVSKFMGYLKGKSTLMIYDRHPELQSKWVVLCQDLVQVKMSFSHSNLPAIPKLPVDTIFQNHRVTYNRNDYEFVWYYKTFPSIQIPGGMHVCNC